MATINLPSGDTQKTMISAASDTLIRTTFGTFMKKDAEWKWIVDDRFTLTLPKPTTSSAK